MLMTPNKIERKTMTNSDDKRQQKLFQWKVETDQQNMIRIRKLATEFNLSFMEASAAIKSTDTQLLCECINNITLSGPDTVSLVNFDYYMDLLIEKLDG